jgi:hypothetical protein
VRAAVFAIGSAAFSWIGFRAAQAEEITYKCGDEATIRADPTKQFIIWISPDGTQEMHRAQIDDAYIVWDMRAATPLRIDRKTGVTDRWINHDKAWKNNGVSCRLER